MNTTIRQEIQSLRQVGEVLVRRAEELEARLDAGEIGEPVRPVGPITRWDKVAEIVGKSVSQLNRVRKKRPDLDPPTCLFPDVDAVHEWWRKMHTPVDAPLARSRRR